MTSRGNKVIRVLVVLYRVLLGALFVFSGVAKGVDPMGSAIMIGEYLNAFGIDWLEGTENFLAIAQSTGEAVLGLLLIFGIRMRATSAVTLAVMVCMSALTLYIALENPVADCGCFGEAIKLSNWGTFLKNAALLLPLSVIVVYNAWMSLPKRGTWRDWVWGVIFAAFFTGISLWGLRHLPLIDFLPYKKGVSILDELKGSGQLAEEQTRLLYRNISTGEQVEFLMTDTTWYDATTWEYVDTIVGEPGSAMGRSVGEFAILEQGADVTMELLDQPGVLMLLCVSDPAALSGGCYDALRDAAHEGLAAGCRVVAVTPVVMSDRMQMTVDEGLTVDYYNIDDVVLKSLLRAKAGLVMLENGTIIDKFNCRDIANEDLNRLFALQHRE